MTGLGLASEVRRYETAIVCAALSSVHGVQSNAAKLLSLKPTTLNMKLKAYGIDGRSFQMSSLKRGFINSRAHSPERLERRDWSSVRIGDHHRPRKALGNLSFRTTLPKVLGCSAWSITSPSSASLRLSGCPRLR